MLLPFLSELLGNNLVVCLSSTHVPLIDTVSSQLDVNLLSETNKALQYPVTRIYKWQSLPAIMTGLEPPSCYAWGGEGNSTVTINFKFSLVVVPMLR